MVLDLPVSQPQVGMQFGNIGIALNQAFVGALGFGIPAFGHGSLCGRVLRFKRAVLGRSVADAEKK